MKTDSPFRTPDDPPGDPAERLADALLAEQARLGARDDEELLSRILTETVARPAAVPAAGHAQATAPPRFTAREWTQLALSVAAVLALAATVLSLFRFGQGPTTETYHFRVELVEAPEAQAAKPPTPADRPPARPGRAHEGAITPEVFPAPAPLRVSSFTLQDRDFNLLSHFERSLDEGSPKTAREDAFSISAAEADTEGAVTRFRDGVAVTHSDFQLNADRAEVLYSEDSEGENPGSPRLVAHEVELTHFPSASKAKARKAIFDTVSGALTLEGITDLSGREDALHGETPGNGTVVFAGESIRVLAEAPEIHANPAPVRR